MKQNKFSIELTPELRSLVKSVIMAKAWVESIHPIVTGYQKDILKEIGAVNEKGEPITNPLMYFSMDEELFKIYFGRCAEEAARNGLQHEPECCPLLEAESLEREAKRAFGTYIFSKLPGCGDISYGSLNGFLKDADGKIKKDKLGRYMFQTELVVDAGLKILVPQMRDELEELKKEFMPPEKRQKQNQKKGQ